MIKKERFILENDTERLVMESITVGGIVGSRIIAILPLSEDMADGAGEAPNSWSSGNVQGYDPVMNLGSTKLGKRKKPNIFKRKA